MTFLKKLHGTRGIAVIGVLLFHFFEKYFPGGFLGVDLFFLLSGFLVTKSTVQNLNINPNYSKLDFLKSFYSKRVARIFPMVVFSSLISLLTSLLFAQDNEVKQKISFFLSSIIGFTNIKLFNGASNYFATDQEFNFFTQTWSLGIEEQFYLIFSLAGLGCLIFFPLGKLQRTLNIFFVSTFLISFMIAVFHLGAITPEAIFYLLPFRWWELSLGVIIFLNFEIFNVKGVKGKTENIFLCLLVSCLFFSYDPNWFPLSVILPVSIPGIFFLLSSNSKTGSLSESILESRFLQYFGTISYSLYLNHWIILVFIKHTFGLSTLNSIIGILLSVIVSQITFLYIEKPGHNYLKKKKEVSIGILMSVTLFSLVFYQLNSKFTTPYNPIALRNFVELPNIEKWGEELVCHGSEALKKLKDPFTFCLSPTKYKTPPEEALKIIFLTGDSHAAQMFFMIKEAIDQKKYEIRYINTESQEDIYAFSNKGWSHKKSPMVFERILKESKPNDFLFLTFASNRLEDISEMDLTLGLNIWKNYLEKFKRKGVNVILVKDSPIFEKTPVELCAIQATFFKNFNQCIITKAQANSTRRKQDIMFETLKSAFNIQIFDLQNFFCSELECSMMENGKLTYYDNSHYTKEKSQRIAPELKNFIDRVQ